MIEIQLAQGLWRDGAFQRDAVVAPLDGWAEMELLEHTQGRSAAEIANHLLARCVKQMGRVALVGIEDVAELTIGDRERLLFGLYRASFGTRIELTARCPACEEITELEFAAETSPPDTKEPTPIRHADYELDGRRWRIAFRLPTGKDQTEFARAGASDLDFAARGLVRRCIAEASCDGASVPAEPDGSMMTAFEVAARRDDPAADGIVHYVCVQCGTANEVLVDATSILRSALLDGRGILLDVHRLARAYHWREQDILALGTARRREYLAMINREVDA